MNPTSLPTGFSVEDDGYIILPADLPADFITDDDSTSSNDKVTLPITLPMSFEEQEIYYTIKLPITLPMKLETSNGLQKVTYLVYKENVNLKPYYGVKKVAYKEKGKGLTTKIPFKERAWKFDGLILNERVLSHCSDELTISENIQALILVDFELVSSNTLKIKWYGNSVPSFTVMKKSAIDENYTPDGQYSWETQYALINIQSEDYNVYLQGTANSGSSAVYTIAGTNDVLVIPKIDVLMNEKIYTMDINYEGTFYLNINY